MNPRTPFVAAIFVCGVSLGLLVTLASSADAESELVRFRPGSAAPRADWVECGAGRYWSVYGARSARGWTECGTRAETCGEPSPNAASNACDFASAPGAYVVRDR